MLAIVGPSEQRHKNQFTGCGFMAHVVPLMDASSTQTDFSQAYAGSSCMTWDVPPYTNGPESVL